MRKIGIAVIGVFGAAMEEMQVSLTLVLVFLIILLTAIQRPYGESKNGMLLQRVELSTLCMLFLTLWAAGVFTLYPRCEVREGESLWWCELMSVLVGLADALLVIFVILLFVWLKGADASCLKRCFGKLPKPARESLTRTGSKLVLKWDLWHGGEAAVQARIRAWTVDAGDKEDKEDDGTNGNGGRDTELAGVQPSSSNDTAAVSENSLHDEISKSPQKVHRRSTKLPGDWQKYNDAEGRRYYTHAETGQSQWEMPEGATKGI